MVADLIIENANVITMDAAQPKADAVAIRDGVIVAVGTRAEVVDLAGSARRVVDAGGGTVLPGFVESHVHLFIGAFGQRHAQLQPVNGFDELCRCLRRHAEQHPDEGLLVGHNADYTILGGGRALSRQVLDDIIADRALMLVAGDFHTAWANTIALERAGILEGRQLGVGNEIVMGDDGLATGELREKEAMGPVMDLATSGGRENLGITGGEPDDGLTPQQRAEDIETLRFGLSHCAAQGITALHNMDGNFYQLELLAEIEREHGLDARVQVPYHFTNKMPMSNLDQASEMASRFCSDTLYSGRVKIFIDGVIDTGTAVLVDDYADQPGWCGEPLFPDDVFREIAVEIDRRGLQISVHAIGDQAVRSVLDGYAAARQVNGLRDSRHRIEHIEMLHPDDLARFAELGVLASMQPIHLPGGDYFGPEPTRTKIGEARWGLSYAWRALEAAGARLVFSSDWPVAPLPPLDCIKQAVSPDADQPGAERTVSLETALRAYTANGAYAGFLDGKTGCLKTGYDADIVVLSGDIETVAVDEIDGLTPVMTLCRGRATYQA